MKSHTEYLTFDTHKRREYINITDKVAGAVRKSGVAEGMVLVSAMHITAGVWVNDAEDGLLAGPPISSTFRSGRSIWDCPP